MLSVNSEDASVFSAFFVVFFYVVGLKKSDKF